MRIALVHDWLVVYGGAERVLEQMLQVFPDADVYALVDFLPASERHFLGGRPVRTSFLQHLPLASRHYRSYLPVMPLAVEQFDVSGYDIVISSSHAVAKGVITAPDQLHMSYVHTPMRYAWELQHQYLEEARMTRGLRSWLVRYLLHQLRMWDAVGAHRVDCFVANSRFVAERVRKAYRRHCSVIHPPVDVDAFPLVERKDDHYVTVSRLVPYKRVGLIVDAFNAMPDRRLVVVGDGPELERLRSQAGPNVEIVGHLSPDALRRCVASARAFVYAAEEDFGIAAVEAQACGTPVIAYGRGGVAETVRDGETGVLYLEQSAEDLRRAVLSFEARPHGFDAAVMRASAERFGVERFRHELGEMVMKQWTELQGWKRPATVEVVA